MKIRGLYEVIDYIRESPKNKYKKKEKKEKANITA